MPLTEIIRLFDVIQVPDTKSVVLITKEDYSQGTILIAQTDDTEIWYSVISKSKFPVDCLKKDVTTYILSPYTPPIQ